MTSQELVAHIEKWKVEKGNEIINQMQRLGATLDWSRQAFTMDGKFVKAVKQAVITLFESGYVYRDNKIVNWSCALQSAISDIEVENVDISAPTPIKVPGLDRDVIFGQMHHVAFAVENTEREIVVATTRPETLPGDVAIAVHPEDPRFFKLHGRYVIHPVNGKRIPIVLDDIAVDPELGSGAVKVTPSHDATDYGIASRANLQGPVIFTSSGHMAGKHVYVDVFIHDSCVRLQLLRAFPRACMACIALRQERRLWSPSQSLVPIVGQKHTPW